VKQKQIGRLYLFVVLMMLILRFNYCEDGIEFGEGWLYGFQWDLNTFAGS
jgi:hypothetical protein